MRTIILVMMMAMAVWGQDAAETDSREEAKRIWELAIKAKGGREKLHAVRNMVITTTDDKARPVLFIKKKKREWSKKKYKHITVSFYSLPGKWWYWDDNRPSIWGLEMWMKNYETMKKYIVSDGGPFYDIKTWKPKERGIVEDIDPKEASDDQAMLADVLLETRWVQPKIEGVTSGKVGRKKVNTIKANGIGYMIDRDTHLVLRIVSYDEKEKIIDGIRYSDYVAVDGVMMPTKVTYEDPDIGDYTLYKTYQINVEYNEDIFKRPPLPIEEAKDAWKKGWKPSKKKENK